MQNVRKIVTITVTLASLCLRAEAKDNEPSSATGVGTQTCAVFAMHYRDNPKLAELVYGSWAQGFMAGLNFGGGDQKNMRNVAADSTEERWSHLRDFCDRRPLAIFMEGVMIYFFQLKVGL
jgi:hypothetical protein